MNRWQLMTILGACCASAAVLPGDPPRPATPIRFERDIQPILSRCVQCHGPDKAKAGLRLDSLKGATARLRSGHRAIVSGKPDESVLLERVTAEERTQRMPPRGDRVTAAEVEKLRRWIAAGADWPEHWAYRPLKKLEPPSVAGVTHPIDRFVRHKLAEQGLSPVPAADRRTLVRRVYFDLIGLPPTPADMDAALEDKSLDWYEKIVDRLLASPRHGERWARHWMDVVHYAETHGHDQDRPREHAWPYRDYLIRAFNADTPYGRFVQEQVAGDVLFPDDPWATVATGFLATGPWDESSLRDIREDTLDREIARYLDRDDIVTTVMSTFVSTTVHCARCHDHKLDPVPTAEYYGLQAVFAGTDKANRAYDLDPLVGFRRRQLAERRSELAKEKALADPTMVEALGRRDRDIDVELPAQQRVYCGTSVFIPDGSFRPGKGPRPVHVLDRGDVRKPGAQAQPGALSCVPGLEHRFALSNPGDEGSRRAALAHWLTNPRNGLTWRSIANRVWQFHFGRGLVETPNDFGRMGAAPTHPELLDWLAMTLQEKGGSLKHLHRLIVTSGAYRQSCRHDPACAALDAGNAYLWRMNRQRLDAESIHDAVLQMSGKLDAKMGGPSVRLFIQTPGIHVTPNVDYQNFNVDDPASYRRSVYRFVFRTIPDPFMESLDCPDGSQLTPARGASVTALQALALLNDKFMVRQSEHLAKRVEELEGDPQRRVTELYRLVLGRAPRAKEAQAVSAYAATHGLANACRMLLNSNEFVFVD